TKRLHPDWRWRSWMSSRPACRQIFRCDPLSRRRRFPAPLVSLSSMARSGACAPSGAPPRTTAATAAAARQAAGFRHHLRIGMLRPTTVLANTFVVCDQMPRTSDELLVLDCELTRAECAVDKDDAVFVAHFAPVFLGETRQHVLEVHDRAAASARQRHGGEDPDLRLLVKQSPDQLFLWQMGVDQLHGLDRLGEDRDVLPFGVVHANVKPLAPLLALGEVLKQKTAGDGSSVVKSHRRANQRRNLLAPREVSFDRGRKRFPLERDHA